MTAVKLPLVITCHGASRSAQLAGKTAAALAELAAAETVEDPELLVAQALAGRDVIVLDGCASACSARLIEAKGVRPRLALNLDELGAAPEGVSETGARRLAEEIARRIRRQPTAGRRARPPRPARPTSTSHTKRAHGVNDYLLAIDALASTVVKCGALAVDSPTLAAHVSRLLAVSRASAGEMLTRLEAAGLVERSAHKELVLTGKGRAEADRVVRRHRLLERMASEFLGYPPAESYEQARSLDGAFDDEAIERVSRALGDPLRCPHGWPIDPALAREESRELTTLAALATGELATVARLVEQDGPFLAQLYELGLVPETKVTLADAGDGDELIVRIDGKTYPIDVEAASKLLVRQQA